MTNYEQIYNLGYDSQHLFKERQLGQNIFLDDINVYDKYNADLISITPTPPVINNDFYKSLGKNEYKINKFKTGDNGLEIRFYVGGHTQQEAEKNVNQLVSVFINKSVVIKSDETGFEYVCTLSSFTSEYTGVEFYYLLTLVVNAIKRLPLVTYDFDSSYFSENTTVTCTFKNEGVVESGVDIIIRFGGATDFSVSYLKSSDNSLLLNFTNLSTSNYFYKIGGIKGVVHRSGNINFNTYSNVFLNTNLLDFPIVKPGENNVVFTQDAVSRIKQVKIQFYPVFII